MTSGFFSGQLLRGLAVRVLFFLTLALLPMGLIAISQTRQIAEDNRLRAELSLLAVTEQVASGERAIIQQAASTAAALGPIVLLKQENTVQCSDLLRAYQQENTKYSLVGFINADGIMACSSASREIDFSDDPYFSIAVERPGLMVTKIEEARSTGGTVTVVTAPVFEDAELVGFIAVSIPFETFQNVDQPQLPLMPTALLIFNKEGEVLTSKKGLDVSGMELPETVSLKNFVGQPADIFRAPNTDGVDRVFTVYPLVENAVYALGVWPDDVSHLNPGLLTRLSTLLPIAMWAASLVVAFWALNRLAIRHIRKLGRQMRRFAINRNLPRNVLGAGVPTELVEMEAAFINMGESILRDEATLEDSLREKNILLKEVHHRVKNNLQLISSIMNMQIRQAKTEDAGRVLRRLQERILSLATVHKNLYQTDDLARVDASVLLHEVVNQILAVGLAPGSNVDVTQQYAPISLDADDAAPLTLLVSEAMTNALKNIDQDGSSDSAIRIELTAVDAENAMLLLSNTKGAVTQQEGTGLGSRLIEAFARQLNGRVEINDSDDSYRITVTFPVPQDAKQVYDY